MRDRVRSRARSRKSVRAALLSALIVLVLGGVAVADGGTSGQVGPALHLTGNGHLLHPVGTLTPLGNFPTGSAVLPGGAYVWVTDCGHGQNDVRVLDVRTHHIVQTLPLPGCYGGIAFSPNGTRAYVGGTPKGSSPIEGPTKGDAGDVVHVFTVNPATGTGTEGNPIQLPTTSGGSGQLQSLPPASGVGSGYPEGLAVSPDGGKLLVALNAADKAVLVDLRSGAGTLIPIGAYPNGAAFDPQGRGYVSNEYDGTISVIDPASAKVTATIHGLGGALGDLNSHPEGMVADPVRHLLYVAVTNRDLVAVVDTDRAAVSHLISVGRTPGIGTAPTKLALSPDGSTLYSADAGEDAVAAISLTRRPAAIRGHRVYSPPSLRAIRGYEAAQIRLTRRLRRHLGTPSYRRQRGALVRRYLGAKVSGACTGPSFRQEQAYVSAALRALRGPRRRQALALFRAAARLTPIAACRQGTIPNLPADTLIGRLPTAAYPDDVQVTPQGKLIWIAGKGFGAGPNPGYNFAGAKTEFQTPSSDYGTYVLDQLTGQAGTLTAPTDRQMQALSAAADTQSAPSGATARPEGSPVPGVTGQASSQIKHVFYIVRENRTYDQVFGSDPRGDGQPKLQLFDDNGVAGPTGGITPNAHALAHQFPLLDHFYENSEVSVDGHLITSASYATDYVQKATAANYANRRQTFDFGIFPVTAPPKFYLFDQAAQQGVPFRDYGENVGTIAPTNAPNRPQFSKVAASTDNAYPGNLFIGCFRPGVCTQDSGLYNGTGSVFASQSRFNEWYPQFQSQVLTNSVPALNYMILPNDHTNGTTTGDYTPQALIADNDLALGQMVDAISHSSIWSSSAIFVVEDDSQDGADHVDAHRAPAFVISPWAKHGAVVNTRYDQYSMLRTVELLTGLNPLSLNDALATPMYDAFISGSQKPDNTPYSVKVPSYNLQTKNSASAASGQLSDQLPWSHMDAVPQQISDQILYAAVHGSKAPAPAPGPNASPDERDRAVMLRQLLAEASPAYRAKLATAAQRRARCPISWACRPAPPGEG